MIYNNSSNNSYKIVFYRDPITKRVPVQEYLNNLSKKDRAKIRKYMEYLRINEGVLDEPLSKHIQGAIRELRVDFAKNRHRIFYFTFVDKHIFFLHSFLKKTAKTPQSEIKKALKNYNSVLLNKL